MIILPDGSVSRTALPASLYCYLHTLVRLLTDTAPGALECSKARSDQTSAPQTIAMPIVTEAGGHPILPTGDRAQGVVDQRQGAFISGGTVHGSIIGVNYGTVNTYTDVTVAQAGAILNVAPQPSIQRLPVIPRPPRPLRGFLDRERELHALQPELQPGGGAWLHGQRGCGLTALLRHAANAPAAHSLADGVAFVHGTFEPPHLDDILQRLFNRFYTSDTALHVTPQTAQTFLSNLHTLFVLDRLPLGQDELIALADTLQSGAVLFAADGHAPDMLLDLPVAGLPRQDAIRLCADVARIDATRPDNGEPLSRLCALLADLPLPVLLTGRLLNSAAITLPRLVAALNALTGEPLERVLQVILAVLAEQDRAVLTALVHVGGPHADLEALRTISQVSAAEAGNALERLMSLNLVERSGGDRYAITTTSVRRVLEQLLRPGPTRERAAAFFASAGTAALQRGDLAWLELERGSVLTAIDTSLAAGQAFQAGTLAQSIQPMLVLRGMWSSWGQVIERTEQAAWATGDPAMRAWTLHERGTRAGLLGDIPTAATALREALRLRNEIGDREGAAASEHNLRYLDLLPPPPREPARPSERQPRLPRWATVTLVTTLLIVVSALALLWLAPPVVPAPPVANGDTASTSAHTSTVIDVLANDRAATGGLDPASLTITRAPAHATTAVNPDDGSVRYTPAAGFTGVDSFTYRVCDTAGACADAAVMVRVIAQGTPTATIRPTDTPVAPNTPPTVTDDVGTTPIGTAVTINVLANDRAATGGLDPASLTITRAPAHATTAVNPDDGSVRYTPAAGFTGADSFAYRVCDTVGACADADVAITVTNTPLEATDDRWFSTSSLSVTIQVLANDHDADGNLDPASLRVTEAPDNGTALVDAPTGSIIYTLADSLRQKGTYSVTDTLVYTVCDTANDCDDATLTITLRNVPPAARDDTGTTEANTPVTIDVLANDRDEDENLAPDSVQVTGQPVNGQAQALDRGVIRYLPNRGFFGEDRFRYQVCDTEGACSSAAVIITIVPRLPDLVVTTFETMGRVTVNSDDRATVPVRLVITNRGTTAADVFKVSVDYTSPRGTFLASFSVTSSSRPSSDSFYPFTEGPLAPGESVTFEGVVSFSVSLAGNSTTLTALADSCSGEEFTPDTCRVEESNEANNESEPLLVQLPAQVLR